MKEEKGFFVFLFVCFFVYVASSGIERRIIEIKKK